MTSIRFFALAAIMFLGGVATATAQWNSIHKVLNSSRNQRTEIVIPKVNGYNVYKGDFHTHSIFSDGEVTPALRVEEAWNDGLDIIAVTDHMEYRRTERVIYKYMKGYIREDLRGEKYAVNTNVLNTNPDARGLLVDFNVSYDSAKKRGDELGIMVVRGVEITRGKLGDYNAIFTKDNNAIYDPDLETSIRNARAQGAFIMHNHPQYTKETKSTMPKHCEDFHAKGLIDGIEIANGYQIFNSLIDLCINEGYTPFSSSDVHTLTSIYYPGAGKEYFRNMTLVFAKKCDDKSILKALKEGRTIAYRNNMMIGSEKLLTDLFNACISAEVIEQNGKNKKVKFTNHSSLPFSLRWDRNRETAIWGHSATVVNVSAGTDVLDVRVTNMLYNKGKSPVVPVKLK